MAATATQRRSGKARRASAGTSGKSAGKKVQRGAQRAASTVKPSGPPGPSGIARAAARKVLKLVARKALTSGAKALRAATDRTAALSREAVETGLNRRLPIQVSIDVAVPIHIAWEEWMTFNSLTEGVHRIEDVERDGQSLFGVTPGPRSSEWVAEIVDEREDESFAWRSVEGSDCAGLVTFHQLSDRLTRIELDLDVLPTGAGEALALSLHLAHRRAEAELRRFKARVEFINPDVYEASSQPNGRKSKSETD
jgi:uncharacterized membrane protein